MSTPHEEPPCCWVCLSSDGELAHPCRCPADRVVHLRCLARWQLQSAGRSEEHCCRFCQAPYPDWKDTLTPPNLKPAVPVVSVQYNGVCYRLRVKPGPKGLAAFQRQLQSITGMSALDCMQITFQCRAPDDAQELSFRGISAFDAAIHCASISAAERLSRQAPPDQPADATEAGGSSSESEAEQSVPVSSVSTQAVGSSWASAEEEAQTLVQSDTPAWGSRQLGQARWRRSSMRGHYLVEGHQQLWQQVQQRSSAGSFAAAGGAADASGSNAPELVRQASVPATAQVMPPLPGPQHSRHSSIAHAPAADSICLEQQVTGSPAGAQNPAPGTDDSTAGADAPASRPPRPSHDSSVFVHGQGRSRSATGLGFPAPRPDSTLATTAKPATARLASRLRTLFHNLFW